MPEILHASRCFSLIGMRATTVFIKATRLLVVLVVEWRYSPVPFLTLHSKNSFEMNS